MRPHPSVDAGVRVYGSLAESDARRLGWSDRDGGPPIRFDIVSDPARGRPIPAVGDTVDLARLRDAARGSERRLVLPLALGLLSRREHSRVELARKLRRRGFSGDAIDYALEECAARAWQDDRRYAAGLVESRMRTRPVSRMALHALLAERGVDRALADSVVREWEEANPDGFRHALEAAAARLDGLDGTTIRRRLARRGFSRSDINRLLA